LGAPRHAARRSADRPARRALARRLPGRRRVRNGLSAVPARGEPLRARGLLRQAGPPRRGDRPPRRGRSEDLEPARGYDRVDRSLRPRPGRPAPRPPRRARLRLVIALPALARRSERLLPWLAALSVFAFA